jgi:serpin B
MASQRSSRDAIDSLSVPSAIPIAIPIFLALVAACGGAKESTMTDRSENDPADPIDYTPPATAGGSATDPKTGDASAAASEDEASRFAAATNAFAVDLWERMRSEPGNLAVSPASIEVALAMTWGGARGQTAEEMAEVMHFGGDPEALHRAAGHALSSWNDPDREAYRLAVANRLFGQTGYEWREPFLKLTEGTYRAPLAPTDFRASPEAARERINGWVAEQTEDRIENLLSKGTITTDTRMVLANAVYFLADWQHQFKANDTRERAFHGPDGELQAETMHQQAAFGYAEADGVQVLEMPYAGGELGMMVVLPRERDGLGEVEAKLSAERIEGWADALETQPVKVALPKYEIEPPSLKLSETLRAMGMTRAFDPNAADFSAMADPAENEGLPLFISEVVHKAFVSVDEKGTEAAAATAAVMAVKSAAIAPPDVPSFVADHPFLFFIRDLRTGTVLFMGRVTDPTA